MQGRRRRALLISAALLFFTAGAVTLYQYETSPTPLLQLSDTNILDATISSIDTRHRALSIALPNGGCQLTQASVTDYPISPIWQASFPGCGSRMTWHLVQALTGIKTNNDRNTNGWGYENVVAAKTHYPFIHNTMFEELDHLFGRAMLIVRNPIYAIPSYFNAQYEELNHLTTHSVRAPNEDWIKYRDHALQSRLRKYEEYTIYWMEKYRDRKNLLIVTYEDLTAGNTGPIVTMRIADFLGQSEGVHPIAQESIHCVWETVVNYNSHSAGKTLNLASLRVGGPSERPYTEQNLSDSLALFHRLSERFQYDEQFVSIMLSYAEVVSNIVPQD